MAQHPHIIVPTAPDPIRFTSPASGRADPLVLPTRDRRRHAANLVAKLEALTPIAHTRTEEQQAFGLDEGLGIYLTFSSEPDFELKFESLDLTSSGIELCTVKTTGDNRQQATVFVPDGKLDLFIKRVQAYRDEQTTPRRENGPTRPKNQDLIESISDIQLAALEAFWTESELFPDPDAKIAWELWLRRSGTVDHVGRLRANAQAFNLMVGDQTISFVDRQVVLVRGTARSISRSTDILGMIAEIRLPKTTAAFFTDMNSVDQQEWVADLVRRTVPPLGRTPYVCLLDTGLNHLHPLLSSFADGADMHAYKPAWGTDDRHSAGGHGTPMAGLAVLEI